MPGSPLDSLPGTLWLWVTPPDSATLAARPLTPANRAPYAILSCAPSLCPLPLQWLFLPPDVPHGFVLGREFRRVVHEGWHGITDAILVRALQPLHGLIELRGWDRERHLVILRLAKHAITGAGQNHLTFVSLHGPHDNVRTVQPATKGGREVPTAFVEGSLHQAHHLGRIAKYYHH